MSQGGEAGDYLVGGQVFYVGGDGPLVVVGVGDSGQAVAVELVGGLGYGGGAGGNGLGVDGVAVGDVEVGESASGRVLGRGAKGWYSNRPFCSIQAILHSVQNRAAGAVVLNPRAWIQ